MEVDKNLLYSSVMNALNTHIERIRTTATYCPVRDKIANKIQQMFTKHKEAFSDLASDCFHERGDNHTRTFVDETTEPYAFATVVRFFSSSIDGVKKWFLAKSSKPPEGYVYVTIDMINDLLTAAWLKVYLDVVVIFDKNINAVSVHVCAMPLDKMRERAKNYWTMWPIDLLNAYEQNNVTLHYADRPSNAPASGRSDTKTKRWWEFWK